MNVFNKDHTSTSSGQFSLLSAFGQSKPEVPENTGNVSFSVDENQASATESFALKLKEKAANDATAKGQTEPFFFTLNDKRFAEATEQFLHLKEESLSELRSKYEEKRPILASIMKKKLKNKAKKQEKMSFGVKQKGKRKFNPRFNKKSKKQAWRQKTE